MQPTYLDTKIKKTRRKLITPLIIVGALLLGTVSYVVISKKIQTSQPNNQVSTFKEGNVSDIAEKALPAVVSITTDSISFDALGNSQEIVSAGTGFIVRDDGLIITNRHVVEGFTKVSVVTNDGQLFDNAKVVGIYPTNDIAFVKIEASDLPTLEITDSDSVKVGDEIVAIGNALGIFQNSVTSGIISALNRPLPLALNEIGSVYEGLFQIDAAINHGNSGGPLLNSKAQVIGINSAGAEAGAAENLGFSIPINQAKGGLNSLLKTGVFDVPFLGVTYISLSPIIAKEKKIVGIDYGALLLDTKKNAAAKEGGAAKKAGLKAGDVVTKIGGKSLKNKSLLSTISEFQPGESISIEIFRDGKYKELPLVVGSYNEYAKNNKEI